MAERPRYVFLPHTADAKFQAFGVTMEEALANAALAVASVMWDWAKVEKKTRIPVAVEGQHLERALYNYLEEILYLLDTQKFLLAGVEDIRLEQAEAGWRLSAVFVGDADSSPYEIFGEVKAVTYNEMRIEKNAEGVTLQVVIDL